jgi:hypothetical protein
MPTVAVRLTPDQAAWLEAQTKPFRGKSDVVRDLIDSAREGLDRAFTLGGPSAAGTPSKSVNSNTVIEEDKTNKTNTRARELMTPRDMETNPRAKRDPYSRKQLPDDAVPEDLADLADLLREFWSVKKGTRSERAWKRLCNKLSTFAPKDRVPALQAACNAGWADIYEPVPPRARTGQFGAYGAEPESKHPASREFRNGRFVDEEALGTNPVLGGLI